MKKIMILFVPVAFVFMCNSCSYFELPGQQDSQKQIEQLQQEVAVLQKINGLEPSYEIKNDSIPLLLGDKTSEKSAEGKKTVKTMKEEKEQLAMDAIKYCLKMYEPDLKYTGIRSVPQSDGTIDVIIDYKYITSTEHTYYNVTVYSSNEFKVNSSQGLKGYFPYGSKFTIE